MICGAPDWCNYDSDTNDIFWCQRSAKVLGTNISLGSEARGVDGREYIAIKTYETGFVMFEEKNRYESWKKINGHFSKTNKKIVIDNHKTPSLEVEHVAKLATPERCNEVYSALLEILVLEDKDEAKLRNEWDNRIGLFEQITSIYPIKSLPPEDYIRFSSKERLKNLSRKKIMEALVEKVGAPIGVPGFYQRKDQTYTMVGLSGVIFPIFNSKGLIVRIRINDSYPIVDGNFNNQVGIFTYQKPRYPENSSVGWYFIPKINEKLVYESKVLVWQYGSQDNLIKLNKKGYPNGKVRGKYKNFSSFKEVEIKDSQGNHIVNKYTNGCQSGSHCSLYTKKGDNMSMVYVTEGEKKAIVANMILKAPVISLPGVATFKKLFDVEEGYDISILQRLKNYGMKQVAIVYDSDKNENAAVLKQEQQAILNFIQAGFKILVGEWDQNWGKGLDDILLSGVSLNLMYVQ